MKTVSMLAGLLLCVAPPQQRPALTKDVAQQEMRAFGGLPVPAGLVTVTDTIEFDGRWVATVDFAGTPAHVRFSRTGEKWIPAEMSYQRGWIPLSKGFAMITEREENGIRATLRALASGQITYSAVCTTGFYAPTFAALATPEPGKADGFIFKDMAPPAAKPTLAKYNYTIEMTAPPSPRSPKSCNGVPAGGSAQTWSATARRDKGFAGKSFKIAEDGTLTEIK